MATSLYDVGNAMKDSAYTALKDGAQEHSMYIFGISIRTWALVVASPCVFAAIFISVYHMIVHCRKNKDSEIRIHILRILFMVPIYAINGLMALVFPLYVEFFTLLREAYEAITIYSLAQLLFVFLGGETRLRYLLSLQDQAQDEFHLYRLSQNLANENALIVPNRTFQREAQGVSLRVHSAPRPASRNTRQAYADLEDLSNSRYAVNYMERHNQYYKPWYQRWPGFRWVFSPEPAAGNRNRQFLDEKTSLVDADQTSDAPYSALGDSPRITVHVHDQPGSSGPVQAVLDASQSELKAAGHATDNTDQAVISFRARRGVAVMTATDGDKLAYRMWKERLAEGTEHLDGLDPENQTQSEGLLIDHKHEHPLAKSQPRNPAPIPGLPLNGATVLHIDQYHSNVLVDNSPATQAIDPTNLPPEGLQIDTNIAVVPVEYHPEVAQTERTYAHLAPFGWFLKPVGPSRLLFLSKFYILQYVPTQIICALIAMICNLYNVYHPGHWSPTNAYPYIAVILNMSQFFAMYGLFFFLHHFSANLQPCKAVHKALTIKAVVFATFWQSCAITIYYTFLPVCDDETKQPRECSEGEWNTQEQAAGINNFLICVEMFIFAWIHIKVFNWREFGRKLTYDPKKPVLRSVIEFFSPQDILNNLNQHVTLTNLKEVMANNKPAALTAATAALIATSPQPEVAASETGFSSSAEAGDDQSQVLFETPTVTVNDYDQTPDNDANTV